MLGSRARPVIAESRRNPKSVARRRRSRSKKDDKPATVFVLRAVMALVAGWACYLLVFSAPRGGSNGNEGGREGGRGKNALILGKMDPAVRIEKVEVPESRPSKIRGTGPELLENLFRLGENDPAALGRVLEEEDPLKVSVVNPGDFECPRQEDERFSLPDERNRTLEREFKEGKGFIYYQHLRKAGGTGFCEMASRNMPPSEVPTYHCMPDNRGAMATPPWSNREYLLGSMKQNGFRITANEWDGFLKEHLTLPGAVFATTFRHPVDRWYSQYRFEHVEHRDGSKKDSTPLPFDTWYKRVKPFVMGDNYYVKAFCGFPNPPENALKSDLDRQGRPKYVRDLNWSFHKFNNWGDKVTWEQFSTAIEILKRFNLILVLDFVDDEMWALEESLGWTQPRKVVLPHEKQAVRESKKSISAREALEDDVWAETLQSNVFDVLLFHWAKRVYLERSACRHSDEGGVVTETNRR